MSYKVTLIEGSNDVAFDFITYEEAQKFIEAALESHIERETEDSMVSLAVEIEKDDEF